MNIRVNGTTREVPDGLTLDRLLAILDQRSEGVAVAVNLEFVPKSAYQHTRLSESDTVEIVAPIAGGLTCGT